LRKDVLEVETQASFLKPKRGGRKREVLQHPVVRRTIEGVRILIGGIMIGLLRRVFPERTPSKPERELVQAASIAETIAELHLPPETLPTLKESAEGQRQKPQPLSEGYRNVQALVIPLPRSAEAKAARRNYRAEGALVGRYTDCSSHRTVRLRGSSNAWV
jgi:hypothetical protein